MQIKVTVQGKDAEADRSLFADLCGIVLRPDVHQSIGTAVSSMDGDIWIVATREDGACLGFAQARHYATGMHLRYTYSTKADVRKRLAKEAIRIATESNERTIYTNERGSDKLWPQLGFSFTPHARGEFGRWEKRLKDTQK